MYYLPIIGAFALASIVILERIVLRKRKINLRFFLTAAFLSSIIVMLPLLYFFWGVSPEAWHARTIMIFLVVVLISIFANLCVFYAFKWEQVTRLQPALIMEPLFTVLLAFVFSFFVIGLYDRSPQILIPAIISGLALVFSNIKKNHIKINKYFLAAVLGSFLYASELVVSRLILDYYTPISFYFLRCSFVFLFSLFLFKPEIDKVSSKIKLEIFIIGALWVVFRIIVYYGYLKVGIVFTTLLVMLGPVFVYVFARIFLKEKFQIRNIIASGVIIACVLYVMFA